MVKNGALYKLKYGTIPCDYDPVHEENHLSDGGVLDDQFDEASRLWQGPEGVPKVFPHEAQVGCKEQGWLSRNKIFAIGPLAHAG